MDNIDSGNPLSDFLAGVIDACETIGKAAKEVVITVYKGVTNK